MIKHLFISMLLVYSIGCSPAKNTGKPWADHIQEIPGRIECEFYNLGGEGVAYHDSDAVNNGSGKLNPANGTYLNEFRMKEAVDISYTKTNNVDNNPFNKSEPQMNHLYVGWTQPGEWINYTIKVNETAEYKISLMYTANGDGAIGLDIDGKQAIGSLIIPSTHDDRDTVAWRQWHHWGKLDNLTEINLDKGIHKLTLHVTEHGNMNFDYFEFVKSGN